MEILKKEIFFIIYLNLKKKFFYNFWTLYLYKKSKNINFLKLKDCEDSCPVPIPPPEEKVCKIWSLDCMDLVAIALFILFSSTFLLAILASSIHGSSNPRRVPASLKQLSEDRLMDYVEENDQEKQYPAELDQQQTSGSLIQKIGFKTEQFLDSVFRKIGFFCASYPITVLIAGILFCLILSGGFYYFSVLTDPVELWSPADSETRLNKNYYDSHFRPFYRTTQIIIRPIDQTPWIHSIFDDSGAVQYSAAFQLDF